MKLLVTGGAGFIGSNFVHYWLAAHPEDQVTVLDSLTYAGNLANLEDAQQNPRFSFVKGDITDAAAVAKAMTGCDTVVHFAAETHVDRSVTGPAVFVQTNVIGTQVLLDEARRQNVTRFHHVSTDEVFGSLELDSTDKFSEETPYDPSSPYSASKAASDMLVRAYHRTYGLPVTISNCSNNYGPYHFPEKLIPLMVLNALEDKPLPVYGNGLQVRDWIHVEDHAKGIELVLQKGTVGETYCLGGESERTNIDVVKQILALTGKPESLIAYVTDRPGHDQRYAIDCSKARKELGYAPRFTFEEGLKQTVEWFKSHPEWAESVRSGAYQEYYATHYGSR
jgi:dTDP-glucose 4,6-dehydratase